MITTKQLQEKIRDLLNNILTLDEAEKAEIEWDAAKESRDGYNRRLIYAPRVDVAVGPYMINYVTEQEKEKIDRVFTKNLRLIEYIIEKGEKFSDFSYNENPRCLIAIEVEDSGSKKHLVGDITNASILGKLGIIVPTNEKNYKAFRRIMNYLEFAQANGKMSNNVFKNIVLIKSEELISLLENFT